MLKAEIFKGTPAEWNEYVIIKCGANIYHLYEWGTFFKKIYGLEPVYIAAYDGVEIRGGASFVVMRNYMMKKVLVSLPYFCIGGILSDDRAAEQVIVEKVRELTGGSGYNYALIRSGHAVNGSDFDRIDRRKSTFVLPLDDNPEKVFSSFDKQVRRRIRKGYKSGCTMDISNRYLDDFYDIYRTNMRLLGSPVHKRSFYSNVLEQFPDNYTVLVVKLDGKVIGAQFLSYFKDTVYLPMASSLKEYNKYSPNHLLYWESIKYGCERGYKQCDFGRSTVDSGTYVFKKQWNASEVPLSYCYLYSGHGQAGSGGSSYSKLDLISDLWKKMPLGLTNAIGPYLARWLP